MLPTLSDTKIHRFGVRITNYIFSREDAGVDLTSTLWQEDTVEATADWRRGFYGAGESSCLMQSMFSIGHL